METFEVKVDFLLKFVFKEDLDLIDLFLDLIFGFEKYFMFLIFDSDFFVFEFLFFFRIVESDEEDEVME